MQTISISNSSPVATPAAQVEAVSEPLPTTQQNFSSILEKQRKQNGSQLMDQPRKPQQNTSQMPKSAQKDSPKMTQSQTAQTPKSTDAKPRDAKPESELNGAAVSETSVPALQETGQRLSMLALLPSDEPSLEEGLTESKGIATESAVLLQMQAQLQAQIAMPSAQILPASSPAVSTMQSPDAAADISADLRGVPASMQDIRRAVMDGGEASGFANQPNALRADSQANQKSSETWLQNALPMSGVDTGSERNMVRRMDQSVDTAVAQTNAGQGLPTGITLSANAMQQLAQGVGSANVLNSAPGKSGWDQAMSQKIVWMLGTGTQSAELTLNPPDLGPLQVVIQVNNDQANAQFMSENPAVRQALEAGLEQLREKLSESGVQLGQTSVSDGSRQQSGYGQAAHDASRPLEADRNASVLPVAEQHAPAGRSYGSNGLINTFA